MFGIVGFVVVSSFVNTPLLVAIALLVIGKIRKIKVPWPPLAILLVLQFGISSILVPHYYNKAKDYFFLKMLNPLDVVSICVDSKTWTASQDIEGIVKTLNQAVWHETNHDSGGPFVSLRITLRSGDVWNARVGRYYDRDGALVEFFRPQNRNATWEYGDTYIPGLISVLRKMDSTLPSGSW